MQAKVGGTSTIQGKSQPCCSSGPCCINICDVQGGVWVIGTMRGSASVAAGVQQGDELLEVDMQSVQSSTPFQASLQVQGGDRQPQPPPPVKLKVRFRMHHLRAFSYLCGGGGGGVGCAAASFTSSLEALDEQSSCLRRARLA